MKKLSEVCTTINAMFAIPAADNGYLPPVCSEGVVKQYLAKIKEQPEAAVHGVELDNGRMLWLCKCKEKGRGGGTDVERFKDGLRRIITSQLGTLYVPTIISKTELLELYDDIAAEGKDKLDEFTLVSGTLGKEVLFELEDESNESATTYVPADSLAESTDSEQQEDVVVESPSPTPTDEEKGDSDEDSDKPAKSIYDPNQKPIAHLCPECKLAKRAHVKTAPCYQKVYDEYPVWTCTRCKVLMYCSYDYSKHRLDCDAKDYPPIELVDDIDERFKSAGETVAKMKDGLNQQINVLAKRIKKLETAASGALWFLFQSHPRFS